MRESAIKRNPPPALWFAIIVLIGISVIQTPIAFATGRLALLAAVAAQLVLCYGLYHGQRWAFVIAIALATLGVLVTLTRSPAAGVGVLLVDALIVVPLILARSYFWNSPTAAPGRAHYCARCGQSVTAVTESTCPQCGEPIRRPTTSPHV